LRNGASGYLLKEHAVEHLFEAIRTVARGELYLDPDIPKTVLDHPPSGEDHPYEQLMIEGKAREVGMKLGIGDKIADRLRANIMRKMQGSSPDSFPRLKEAIRKALRRDHGPENPVRDHGPRNPVQDHDPGNPVQAVRDPGNQGHLGSFVNSGDSVAQESGKYPKASQDKPLPEKDETKPPNEQAGEKPTEAPSCESGHEVVNPSGNVLVAIEQLNSLLTDDVVVVDSDTLGLSGPGPCPRLTRKAEKKAVLILAGQSDENTIIRAFECGALGFLLKENSGHLHEAIRTVARRELYLDPGIPKRVMDRIRSARDQG